MNTDKYIDLHLHLDGAVTVDIAKQLAKIQNITLPAQTDAELEKLLSVPDTCTSLNDFLQCFALPLSLMQTKEGLSTAVKLVLAEQQKNGVIYAELRFAPQLHTQKDMTQEDAVLAALDGLKKSNLKANLILCLMRGSGNEGENLQTLQLAKKYLVQDGGVTALDLAGAEALFPTENYRGIFAKAKEYGIPFTIHAGEADGAQSVKLAIEYGAARIGHGVRAREDKNVLDLIIKNGITLEMCPTSNRQTHAVEDMSDYPFTDYLNYGIKVTVNTDDPAIERTDIAKEFKYLCDNFAIGEKQRKILLENAINAAFTSPEVKEDLAKTLLGGC